MSVYVSVRCVWMCAFCIYVCVKVDAVYNFILFQLRYILFTCILHANMRQQLYVVRMYVCCIQIPKCYFLFHAKLFCSVIFGVCLCYCDVCQNATVSLFGRDNKVIFSLEFWSSPSRRGHWRTERKWMKLPVKSSVVPRC